MSYSKDMRSLFWIGLNVSAKGNTRWWLNTVMYLFCTSWNCLVLWGVSGVACSRNVVNYQPCALRAEKPEGHLRPQVLQLPPLLSACVTQNPAECSNTGLRCSARSGSGPLMLVQHRRWLGVTRELSKHETGEIHARRRCVCVWGKEDPTDRKYASLTNMGR